jgi:acyl carrier protein
MNRSDIVSSVSSHLASILEIDASTISESQSFADDLGADSITLIELVDSLEQEFSSSVPDFQFDDDDLPGLRTVADAVDYIARTLGV